MRLYNTAVNYCARVLEQAMSALEVMDPKMDAGMNSSQMESVGSRVKKGAGSRVLGAPDAFVCY